MEAAARQGSRRVHYPPEQSVKYRRPRQHQQLSLVTLAGLRPQARNDVVVATVSSGARRCGNDVVAERAVGRVRSDGPGTAAL
jgi:hypothetical protein